MSRVFDRLIELAPKLFWGTVGAGAPSNVEFREQYARDVITAQEYQRELIAAARRVLQSSFSSDRRAKALGELARLVEQQP